MNHSQDESIKKMLDTFVLDKYKAKEVDLLRFFAFYISSNPDFQYNGTYLTDLIEPFIVESSELNRRYRFYRYIAKAAAKKSGKMPGVLIFDNFIKFKITDIESPEFVNIDQFNFKQIDNKAFVVKFSDGNEHVKSESYQFSFNFKEKEEKEKMKRSVVKKWVSFMNNI